MNTIVIFFSRADENYFGGAMKYVEVGNTEIAVGHITELTGFDSFKLEMVQPYDACRAGGKPWSVASCGLILEK